MANEERACGGRVSSITIEGLAIVFHAMHRDVEVRQRVAGGHHAQPAIGPFVAWEDDREPAEVVS